MIQVQKVKWCMKQFSLKISYSTHICLAQLDQHQTCKPVMVSVVSSSPTGGNFIFFKYTLMLILYKNVRNVRFVLFTKTSIDANFVQKCQKCQICVIYKNLYYLDNHKNDVIYMYCRIVLLDETHFLAFRKAKKKI